MKQVSLEKIETEADVFLGLQQLLLIDDRLQAIAELSDPPPLRLQEPGFPGLARIIVGQQVSRASADAINDRFAQHINPITPQRFLEAGEPAWIEIGLSRAKQKTLAGLSEAILSGELPIDTLITMPAEEAMTRMTALKGIGPWTAEVYLLFCAGHPDIFPAGDLALQEAIRQAFDLKERPNERETREITKMWTPFRGVAARLFWSYYKYIKRGRDSLPL